MDSMGDIITFSPKSLVKSFGRGHPPLSQVKKTWLSGGCGASLIYHCPAPTGQSGILFFLDSRSGRE